MKQERARQTGVGQVVEHVERIAHVEADIGQPAVPDMSERPDDPVQERLGPDQSDRRIADRLRREVLARPEADLQPQGTRIAEQRRGRQSSGGNADLRQQRLDEVGLTATELMPLPPAI